MIVTTQCPVCGHQGSPIAHAVVAPWLVELVGLDNPVESELFLCPDCGTSFFSARYDDAELGALYGGYRGPDYVHARRRWEPWYRDSVNKAFEPGSPATENRVRFMEDSLHTACPGRDWSVVVDVGGDAGQFFPTSGVGRRILIDPSNKPLPQGVERVASLGELRDRPDLALLAHLLEHLVDPVGLLREAHDVLADDGRVYVEVPWDLPRTRPLHRSPNYGRWLTQLAGHRRSYVAADFVSGVARQYQVKALPLPVVKQSEHINYFTPDSLVRALDIAGFETELVRHDAKAAPAGLRLGLISAVAKKKSS